MKNIRFIALTLAGLLNACSSTSPEKISSETNADLAVKKDISIETNTSLKLFLMI